MSSEGELLACPLCGGAVWEQKWVCQVRLGSHRARATEQRKIFECLRCSHRVYSTTAKPEEAA